MLNATERAPLKLRRSGTLRLFLMTTAANRAPRPISELSADERQRLEHAHQRLREAVAAYQKCQGGVERGRDVPVQDADSMAAAQSEIQAAEDELWRLREELLGWARPASATRAELVADWFSEEDRVYDDAPTATT